MAVNIADSITNNWPTTEGNLTDAGTEVGYATRKANAIARAKADLYGTLDIPTAEGDIPDVAAYWIADKACLYLIPVAQDHYALKRQRSNAMQNATITNYDLVAELERLAQRLEKRVAAGEDAALEAILSQGTHKAGETPVVSAAGLIVDPLANAYRRRGYY